MRLSSETFSLSEQTIKDKFMHLTNNAIQKHGKNYGKFESGNIISYADYEVWILIDQSNSTELFPPLS